MRRQPQMCMKTRTQQAKNAKVTRISTFRAHVRATLLCHTLYQSSNSPEGSLTMCQPDRRIECREAEKFNRVTLIQTDRAHVQAMLLGHMLHQGCIGWERAVPLRVTHSTSLCSNMLKAAVQRAVRRAVLRANLISPARLCVIVIHIDAVRPFWAVPELA